LALGLRNHAIDGRAIGDVDAECNGAAAGGMEFAERLGELVG